VKKIIFILILTFALGCKKKERSSFKPKSVSLSSPKKESKKPHSLDLVDEEGILLPSKIKAFGMPIPKGVRLERKGKTWYSYIGNYPRSRLVRFYRRHLVTGKVEHTLKATVFFKAMNPKGDPVGHKANVYILSLGQSRSRITIFDQTSPYKKSEEMDSFKIFSRPFSSNPPSRQKPKSERY
jgi:hypothetical protein